MSKWFRFGMDITAAAYQTSFGGTPEIIGAVKSWLAENCRNEYHVAHNIRKRRSPMVGYYQPAIFMDVTFRRKEDASMFRLFFSEKITTACRCAAP